MKKKLHLIIVQFALIFNTIICFGQAVSLNYPTNGFVTSNQSIELCWNYQSGSLYQVEVALNPNFSPVLYSSNSIVGGKITITNLNSNAIHYWRVRTTSPTIGLWSASFNFNQFNPLTITNLSLWLRADTGLTLNSGTVLTWDDLSVNQYSLTQTVTANQPTLTQNFCGNKSALEFDGNDAYDIPIFNYGSNNTVFVVGKKNGGQAGGRYIGCYGNNMEIAADLTVITSNNLANYTTNNPSLLTLIRTTSPSSFYLNDSLIGSTIAPIIPLANGGLYLGRSVSNVSGGYLTGEIAEILICSEQLNNSLVSLTNRYLMDKYSNILSLGNDTIITDNFCPITLASNIGFSDFLWSTGDTISSINVNTSGTYWLRARDYFGRYAYDTIKVNFPAVNQINSQTICAGNQLIWNSGLNNTYQHHWQNNTSLNQIIISNAGQFYFNIVDSYGCTFYSDTVTVTIDNFANANSIGNDTSLCVGNSVQLQNYPVGNINYLWSTGSTANNIIINNGGQYWLEASNHNNCILRDTINIVMAGTAPQAQFSALNTCINVALNFTDLSIPPLGETINQWQWDFGDGSSSNVQNNIHLYDSAGIYQVSLKVILQSGCGAVFNQAITVFPVPQLNYTSFNLCNDKQAVFNNLSNLFGGTLQSVVWNFGDPSSASNTANTNQATHVYDLPGTYLTQLIVETTEGCIDSLQNTINIKPSPEAKFTASNICLGDNTALHDISEISFPWQTMARKWLFPNGDSSLLFQPEIVFDTAGVYPIQLIIQASNGCSDTIIKSLTIFNRPEASLSYEKNCTGSLTLFTDNSSCSNCQITNYSWLINNVMESNASQFNYIFNDTGTYSLQLSIINNAGCVSTIDTAVIVSIPPISNFTLNSYFGSPPFTPEFSNISTLATTYLWDFGDGNTSLDYNPEHLFNDTGAFTITLTAANSNECTSVFSQVLKLQPKKIDLVLYDVETAINSGYIDVSILVFNRSTTVITGFESVLTSNATLAIKETYAGNLLPGEFKKIQLHTKIKQGDDFNVSDVICVELINVNEGIDSDISNNKLCKALSDSQFKLLNIFPNPAKSEAYLNFISPSKEEITVEVFDVMGNKVFGNIIISELGYNKVAIPTYNLAAGTYTCQVRYNGAKKSVVFIKSNAE